MKVSPLEQYADLLLAANPSEIVVLSPSQLQRIAETELPIDPERIGEAHAVIEKEYRFDKLRFRDRERKRRAKTAGNTNVSTGEAKAVQ